MVRRDVADAWGGFLRGEENTKPFVIKNAQTVGPFPTTGRTITIQISPRSGAAIAPTVSSIVVEGSVDKEFWYTIGASVTINAAGLWTIDGVCVPWIRVRGNFATAEGNIHVYSIR